MRCKPTIKTIRPIFIIGAPRSGTSITTWAIGQLPNVQMMEETSWIATMVTGAWHSFQYGSARGKYSALSASEYELSVFMQRIGESVDAIVKDCYEERCRKLYGDFRATGELRTNESYRDFPFQVRRSVSDPKQRWIDGTPFNTYFTWALVHMFPEAQFIHNLRKPEDVATSLEGFGQNAKELPEGLRTWFGHTQYAFLAEQALGRDRVFRLDFERIGNDREALFREVADFLGEPYTPDILAPLGHRINSSGVDDKRQPNLERLAEIPEYQTCTRLHADVLAKQPSEMRDDKAFERLRDGFFEYARRHPLL